MDKKHIVIDGRIRRTSTGKPVDRLLEHLQELDNKTNYTILVQPDDDWKPRARNFTAVACRYRQFSFNPFNQLSFAIQLYQLKPDLVHFTMTGQQPIFYFGRQTTFTHDLTMFKFVRRGRLPAFLHALRMIGYQFLMWQSHHKALKVLVPTAYVRDAVHKKYLFLSRNIEVTHEASEPPLAMEAKKPDVVNDEPFILYVGTAFPHKNLENLIKAFEIINASQPELKLVLAGKRERFYKLLEKLADQSPARPSVVFTGWVEDSELKWLYQHAQAYVFPSLSEGFGLPGLEAMVHGCPVISSNATCLPEVYGDAAVYFDPENPEEMAAKIIEVISSEKLRQSLIEKGYVQAKKYSWRRMAQQTLDIFKTFL
jgi:glycosyltransferase involved in cell wall biosynthesis